MLLSSLRRISLVDVRAGSLSRGNSSASLPSNSSAPTTASANYGLSSHRSFISNGGNLSRSLHSGHVHQLKHTRVLKRGVLLNQLAFVSSFFTRFLPSPLPLPHQNASPLVTLVQPGSIFQETTATHPGYHAHYPRRSSSTFPPRSSCRLPSPSSPTSFSSLSSTPNNPDSKSDTSRTKNFRRAAFSTRRPRTFSSSHQRTAMAYKVLVPIAEGSEEIEAVCIVDTLRRAGAEVIVANVMEGKGKHGSICMSRKVLMQADKSIKEVENEVFDMIAVPGGMPGAEHCRDSVELTKMLKDHKAKGKWVTAICASPAVVLQHHGLLDGEKAVAYPCFMDKMPADMKGSGNVCVSNKIVTSKGPATALEFALKLVEVLYGAEKAKEVGSAMLMSQ
ncbi:dj-1 family protein [Cystoisospora suis]|uniref:Dj-1 family protein n=1 Tax=Cystoisospora suis TaxID=483139 RepID=A0A2C6L6U7_9APIC|nr:dj-1 family protein [Cystoisospora suis]